MRIRDFSFLTLSQVKFTPCALAAIISVLCVANARASILTYTESATVFGSLNGVSFPGSGAVLTLTGTADTANANHTGAVTTNSLTVLFSVAGKSGTFTDALVVFDIQRPIKADSFAGFNDGGVTPLRTTNFNFAAPYDLSTPIGPITDSSFGSGGSFATSAGVLTITTVDPATNVAGDSTFTAVVTPLPAALPLFATALAMLGLLGWRRKRKAAGLSAVKKLLVAVTTCAAILVSAAPVYAVSFDFSFTNQPPLGGVNGTVTGRIDGLADSGASAATAVFITSSPAGLFYPLTASDNILSQPSVSIGSNSFTVANGVLTAETFQAQFPIANSVPQEFFSLLLNSAIPQFNANRFGPTTNFLVLSTSATFSQVPLPAALPLFATGLGALGVLSWRRKRKA